MESTENMEDTGSIIPSSKWTDGFEHAVVHVAVVVPPKSTSERSPLRLLFASVWLLASGRQAPSRPPKPYIKKFNKEGAIAVDRIVMTAEEAIQWYRSASEELRTPAPLHSFRKNSDGEPLSVGRLSDFPSWPVLGVPMESEDIALKSERSPLPFRNLGIIRYSRRISDSQEWPSFLDIAGQSKQCQEAFQFLEHHMHVDFREYPEYLGGMALAVPDCDVHSIRQFVDPKEDGSESLYFHVKPHPGRKLQGLSLTSMEGQEGMLTSFDTITVPEDGLVVIERPSSIHGSGLILTHTERGVLLQTPMRQFIRQMNMSIEVVERRVKVTAPETDKKKSSINEYFTEEKTLASSQTLGEAPNTTNAFQRLIDAKNERLLNHSAQIYDQTWFTADQRKEALEHIRKKLKHARSSIFIADPYFSANQIPQYLFAIERKEIKIQILTSSSAFKQIKEAEAVIEANSEVVLDTHLTLLQNLTIFQASHKNGIEIRVANTENSLFHDRFIAIDGRVWMIGSSLNSIGIRPTLIMRIPHGEKILGHLLRLYNNALPLEDFKVPREAPKKPHCGREVEDAKEVQEVQRAEDGAEAQKTQGAQDVNNG
ncbi:VPA1262 family N-terminal domain-containing protein [Pectobacterium carotovorum]|uniref:VPA1262 family N-terminal domain-containing protein n=1 Tax=Pectobacterium carotovorum TaxID=554 RepID=UPI0038654988